METASGLYKFRKLIRDRSLRNFFRFRACQEVYLHTVAIKGFNRHLHKITKSITVLTSIHNLLEILYPAGMDSTNNPCIMQEGRSGKTGSALQ